MKLKRLSKIAARKTFQIVAVLRQQRLVEAKRMSQLHDLTGCRTLAEHLFDGIAGNDVDHQENERENEPERRQREQKASQQMARHQRVRAAGSG